MPFAASWAARLKAARRLLRAWAACLAAAVRVLVALPCRLWGWGMSYGRGWGMGFGSSMMMMDGPPLEYYRAVSIVMRDIKTQQIVYETSAQRQDVWTDDPAIFGILFDAALTGFPNPPQGQRNVRTVIQPQPAAGAPQAPVNTPAAATMPAGQQAPAAASPAR